MKTKKRLNSLLGLLLLLNIFMILFYSMTMYNTGVYVDENTISLDEIHNYVFSSKFGLTINWLFLLFLAINISICFYLLIYYNKNTDDK